MSLPTLHPAAERDLEELWDHIAAERVEAANKVISRILEAIEMIGTWPGIGKRRTDLGKVVLHTYTVDGYTIVYTRETDPVRILRIVGRGRDIGGLFQDGV